MDKESKKDCKVSDHSCCCDEGHSLLTELMCHLPFAMVAVAACLAVLSFLTYFSLGSPETANAKGADILFHSFHFMHILFSATGTLITYYRFSKGLIRGIFVGIFSSITFCTMSDAIMPYLAGKILGVDMEFHVCFLTEWGNIIPFLVAGLISGVVIGKYHKTNLHFYSLSSHSLHILVSSFASTFYLVARGFANWYAQIGAVFVFLVIAVVVPCIMSDIVTPMTFARVEKKNESNKVT